MIESDVNYLMVQKVILAYAFLNNYLYSNREKEMVMDATGYKFVNIWGRIKNKLFKAFGREEYHEFQAVRHEEKTKPKRSRTDLDFDR